MRVWMLIILLTASALAGCATQEDPALLDSDGDGFSDEEERLQGSDPADPASIPAPRDGNGDGVVVVAVIDGGFNPYHLDMVGTMMPQHRNSDPSDDLPLDRPPHEWIPGFPDPDEAFASYNRIDLDLDYAADPSDIDESIHSDDLYDADADAWSKVRAGSTADTAHYNFFPGTKVVGMVNTGGGDAFAASSHGVGTSTVSVGNIHGSCPECVLVFVNNGGGLTVEEKEAANDWVLQQDWIDAQTNSYGYSTASRDRMYAGSSTDLQRDAVENGQAIFFSAGNGQANTFTVPNPTLFSSQEGPDWVVTVGAIDPVGKNSYQGHGRPADVASIGSGYPSGGYCDNTINCTGGFGGTSNATPVTAGMYAKALYELRQMAQPELARQPETPLVVNGLPCATAVVAVVSTATSTSDQEQAAAPARAAQDGGCTGALTAPELMDAMFLAAEHKSDGQALLTGQSYPVQTDEMRFLAEGHGSFIGRLDGDDVWQEEWQRIVRVALGQEEGEMAPGEEDWFINDSYCRQSIWGSWEGGWYDGTNLPDPDPLWPFRTALQAACPTVVKTVVDVERIRDGQADA